MLTTSRTALEMADTSAKDESHPQSMPFYVSGWKNLPDHLLQLMQVDRFGQMAQKPSFSALADIAPEAACCGK